MQRWIERLTLVAAWTAVAFSGIAILLTARRLGAALLAMVWSGAGYFPGEAGGGAAHLFVALGAVELVAFAGLLGVVFVDPLRTLVATLRGRPRTDLVPDLRAAAAACALGALVALCVGARILLGAAP